MKQGLLDFEFLDKTLTIKNAFTEYLEKDSFSFIVKNVRNPDYELQEQVFQISLADENQYLINQELVNVTYETGNNIYLLNFTIKNEMVSAQTNYYFELEFDVTPNQGNTINKIFELI